MEEVKTKRERLVDHIEDLTDHVEGLFKTYYRLTVVRITEKAVNIGSAVINAVAVVIFSFFFLLFACFGIAWWLGDVLNSRAGGFLLMAGIFALVIVALIIFRKNKLFPFVRNLLIKKFYDK